MLCFVVFVFVLACFFVFFFTSRTLLARPGRLREAIKYGGPLAGTCRVDHIPVFQVTVLVGLETGVAGSTGPSSFETRRRPGCG